MLALRRRLLSLENTLADSDYTVEEDEFVADKVYFKEDPRWGELYDSLLAELRQRSESE